MLGIAVAVGVVFIMDWPCGTPFYWPRACEYGDAPDGTPTFYPSGFAQTGSFPTRLESDGARAMEVNRVWLGNAAGSKERGVEDLNDPDGRPNLPNSVKRAFDSDDGLE